MPADAGDGQPADVHEEPRRRRRPAAGGRLSAPAPASVDARRPRRRSR